MPRYRKYLDVDVLTMARERLRHIWDIHDKVVVCFSGGKDSLACLHLAKEVAEERGEKVNVLFRDEELIPDTVIDFVDEYRRMPWVDMKWFCVPMLGTRFVLDRITEYVQWDPKRRHIRPIPDHAIRLEPGDDRVLYQTTMDDYTAGFWPVGKIAFVTGVRASESLVRYRSCVNKLNDNYINASSSKRVAMCKPIYDWEENDLFKFFNDQAIRYCPFYDALHLAEQKFRVSTPLHAQAAKFMDGWRAVAPTFWNQVLDLFPETELQERYWHDLDREALLRRYGQSWEGLWQFVDEIEDAGRQAAAEKMLTAVERAGKLRPDEYPTEYVFQWLVTGAYSKMLQPKVNEARA